MKNKMIIYQVFTRLFGNDKTACIPHGNKTENGCGHFADFTQKALTEIQKLGMLSYIHLAFPLSSLTHP